jgi:hypothetical protein
VTVDSICLDCGQPVRVEVKDGRILKAEPEGIVAHVSVPFLKWRDNMAFA